MSVAGKKKYQKIFERLHKLALTGMNISGGGFPNSSGERAAIEYIGKKLSKLDKLIIFDVGSNTGEYAMLLKAIMKDKAELFSFEPSKLTYQKFVLNTSQLRYLKHYNFGFGNEDGKITLFSNADESGLASLYQRRLDHFDIRMNKTEEVEIRTIDRFCLENEITHIHLLKIDVEGHELKVLEGARNLISTNGVDFIQFEFGGCNIDSRTFFQDFYYMLHDRYHLYRILKDGLYKINEYREFYETFATTNYLAERIDI